MEKESSENMINEKHLKDDCIFCKILKGELPSEKVYEDEDSVVIKNIAPVVDTHLLIIPKIHTENLEEYEGKDEILGKLINTGLKVKKKLNLDSYRLIVNVGEGAGQSVMHTHIHILNDPRLKDTML